MVESILITTGMLVLVCLAVCSSTIQSQRIPLRPSPETCESWQAAAERQGLTVEQWLLSRVGIYGKEGTDNGRHRA